MASFPTHRLEVTAHTAHSKLSFSLKSGESICLQGTNGSGKTALLSCLAGVPSHPEFATMTRTLNGREIVSNDTTFASLIHWQGHRPALTEGLSIAEEWKFWQRLMHAAQPLDMEALANKLDLLMPLSQDVSTLSAGEKQKVALARLFLAPRPIWLMDEPEHHLDKRAISMLFQWIDIHCSQGGMVLFSSHADSPASSYLVLGGN